MGLTDRWVDGLAAHLEQQIFFAGMVGTVGCWRQQTIHSATGVAAQRKVALEGMTEFQAKIKPDKLYAAYASYREELGGRPYWLLRTKSKALTNKTIKVPGGTTIAKNQYYVEAQWLHTMVNNGISRAGTAHGGHSSADHSVPVESYFTRSLLFLPQRSHQARIMIPVKLLPLFSSVMVSSRHASSPSCSVMSLRSTRSSVDSRCDGSRSVAFAMRPITVSRKKCRARRRVGRILESGKYKRSRSTV